MKMKCVLMAVAAILTIGSVRAMTMAELQSAIDAAESGGTVYVTSDISYDSALVVTKSVTITSADGSTFTLTRDASYAAGTLVTLATEGANLTVANLVVDGNKVAGKTRGVAVEVSAGTVTLENGFVLQNFYSTIQGCGVYVHTAGHLVMNDGAVIRDLENDSYGVAVLIDGVAVLIESGKSADAADFTMNGGLITGCADHHATSSDGYGGAVYLYGYYSAFRGKGGTIEGNASDNCVAGVNAYLGLVEIEGDFTVTNNVGDLANNLAFRCESGVRAIQVTGDYTGELTLKFYGAKSPTLEEGASPTYIYTSVQSTRRKGCSNMTFEDESTLALDLDEKLYGTWYGTIRRVAARRLVSRTGRWANSFSFDAAFKAVESGDTLALCSNVTVTASYPITNDVTITSAAGGPYAFEREAKNIALLRVSVKSDLPARLTLRDVIVDGVNVESEKWGQTVVVDESAELVMESGAVIRNACALSGGAAVSVGVGAKLALKDGSRIENCRTTDAKPYGSAIRCEKDSSFEMSGGVITGCAADLNGADVASGYGGVVYLGQNVVFDMTGGAITNNAGANGCGGVVNYLGTVKVSGSAVIADNGGTYPDVFNCGVRHTSYYGDFRGRVGISNVGQAADEVTKVVREEDAATGAWGFYPATLTGSTLVGKDDGTGKVVWAEAIGSVEGVKAATVEDLRLLLPTTLDLHEGSASFARLPIVLTGAATELDGTLAIDFDKDSRKHKSAWSIPLLAAGDGEKLTGTWNFVLPEGADRWAVWANGIGYTFGYNPLGMRFIVR